MSVLRSRLPRLVVAALVTASPAPAVAAGDAPARQLAAEVLEAVGGADAWRRTRHVTWNFFGRRRLVWDKLTADVRIQTEEMTILMNVRSRRGRAFRADGSELTGAERRGALERGHAIWVNDSYWMFMPFKLEDPGVELGLAPRRAVPEVGEVDVLVLTFDGVGLTPDNRYEVFVDPDTRLVRAWSFFDAADDAQPRFTLPWRNWQRFGAILLATDHGRGADWEIGVFDTLPDGVYLDPRPLTRDDLERLAGSPSRSP